jgi:hypothetical protein
VAHLGYPLLALPLDFRLASQLFLVLVDVQLREVTRSVLKTFIRL